MDSTVGKHAVIIVKTKLVTQYLVYVTKAVYQDGRVTNVIKVLDVVYYILMLYFRHKIKKEEEKKLTLKPHTDN